MSLKSKFCAKCGKETEELTEGLCSECLLNLEPIIVPSKISVKICPKCNSLHWKGLWISPDKPTEHYVKSLLLAKIKSKPPVEVEDLEILKTGKNGQIKLFLDVGGRTKEEIKNINVEMQKFACPPCSRQRKDHYEAIIQLRSSEDPQKLIERTSKIFQKQMIYITKVDEQAKGIDIYFSSKAVAHNIARSIKIKFGLKAKTSAQAFSWDKQKNRPHHRITYLLKE